MGKTYRKPAYWISREVKTQPVTGRKLAKYLKSQDTMVARTLNPVTMKIVNWREYYSKYWKSHAKRVARRQAKVMVLQQAHVMLLEDWLDEQEAWWDDDRYEDYEIYESDFY